MKGEIRPSDEQKATGHGVETMLALKSNGCFIIFH